MVLIVIVVVGTSIAQLEERAGRFDTNNTGFGDLSHQQWFGDLIA